MSVSFVTLDTFFKDGSFQKSIKYRWTCSCRLEQGCVSKALVKLLERQHQHFDKKRGRFMTSWKRDDILHLISAGSSYRADIELVNSVCNGRNFNFLFNKGTAGSKIGNLVKIGYHQITSSHGNHENHTFIYVRSSVYYMRRDLLLTLLAVSDL